jgi:hypothetical protein
MRRLLMLFALGFLLSGCSLLRAFGPVGSPPPPVSSEEPAPTAQPTIPPATGEITVGGNGTGQSIPFALAEGNYEVRYGATADSPADCTSELWLVSIDPQFQKQISDGHRTGATFVGDVPAGSAYSIQATSTCPQWEVTLQPLS